MRRVTCLKIAYTSRADAKRASNRVAGSKVYACAHCGCFHLSSKSERAIKLTKKTDGRRTA